MSFILTNLKDISKTAIITGIFLLVLVSSFTNAVHAQNKTMEWSSDFCSFSGVYNSKKYTEEKLQNTFKLISTGAFRISTSATVWNYSEIDALDVEKLDEEYTRLRKEVEGLDIVAGELWESVRRSKLKELKQVYDLSRATMLAYRKPTVLNDLDWSPACKQRYVPALIAGGDDLLAVWTDVNVEGRGRNADPARLKRRFDEQYASPQRAQFALVETMAFGWWNCSNASIDYDGQDGDENQKRDEAFRKLFISVKEVECEHP